MMPWDLRTRQFGLISKYPLLTCKYEKSLLAFCRSRTRGFDPCLRPIFAYQVTSYRQKLGSCTAAPDACYHLFFPWNNRTNFKICINSTKVLKILTICFATAIAFRRAVSRTYSSAGRFLLRSSL